MKKIILSVILLFINFDVMAATYYVDFAGGSDSANGTSTSTTWKHCPGDSNATGNPSTTSLTAGDTVVFKKGVSYLGSITSIANSGLLLKTGSNGAITSGGVLTSSGANFQTAGVQAGDEIYIYHSKASVTNTWVESCGLWFIASVDSQTQLTLASFDGVAHPTAEMTYRIVRPITFKSMSSWGSGEAVIDGQATRDWAFTFKVSRVRFEDLKMYNFTASGGGVYATTGQDIHIVNCRFDWAIQALAVNSSSSSNGQYGVFSGCTITNSGSGIGAPRNYYSLYENNTLTGSAAANSSRSLWNFDAYSIARYNTITNIIYAWGGYHGDGFGPVDNGPGDREWQWFYGNYVDESIEFVAWYGVGQIPRNTVFHSNVFRGRNGETGHGDACLEFKNITNAHVYNNTFFGTVFPFNAAMRFTEGVTNATFKNNVFYSPGIGNIIHLYAGNITGHTFAYNHYYAQMNDTFLYDGISQTYAQWRTHLNADSSNYETGSYGNLTTNPNFVDVSSGNVHLASNSPCKDVGTNLSTYFTLDKDKKARGQGSGWDIGAYEYIESVTPPKSLRVLSPP